MTSSVPTWRGLTVYGENLATSQFGSEYFNCEGIYFKVDANNFGARVGWYYYIYNTSVDTQVSFPSTYQTAAFSSPLVSQGSIGIFKNASSSLTGTSLGAGDWLFSNATAEFGTGSAQEFFKNAVENRVFPSSPNYDPADVDAGGIVSAPFTPDSVEFI